MLSLLANIKSALIEYVNKVIDFYTGNPIYSTLFLTAFLPVVAIVVYRWKRKTVANQSIINSAHDKSAHDKKVISLDKKKESCRPSGKTFRLGQKKVCAGST